MVAQSAVIVAVVVLVRVSPRPDSVVLRVAGAIVALAGLLLFAWAYRSMGRSFTPFPRPLDSAELVV